MVILPPLIKNWPQFWKELYEERAAVLEFEAKFSRYAAEMQAERDTRRTAEKDK